VVGVVAMALTVSMSALPNWVSHCSAPLEPYLATNPSLLPAEAAPTVLPISPAT
jgi:hypothetical protein